MKISRALKRFSHQKDSKMLRHFVVAISPEDEGKLQNTELLKAAREISGFFKNCYVLYAVHTDTEHTHFHVLVCNTRISDGKQISMSESDLKRFKEHCSSVLREYGLRPIEKLDKSDELLEINDDMFPKELLQEKRVSILYEGENDEPQYNKPYYCPAPVQNCGNTTTVNVILPPGTQGTLFQGRNGQPCISFKPSPYYLQLPLGNIPQHNVVCDGNTTAGYQNSDLPNRSREWYDQEPGWVKDGQTNNSETDDCVSALDEITYDYGDYDDDYSCCDDDDDYSYYDDDDNYYSDFSDGDDSSRETVINSPDNKPSDGSAAAEIPKEKVDPFVIINGKIDPFIIMKYPQK